MLHRIKGNQHACSLLPFPSLSFHPRHQHHIAEEEERKNKSKRKEEKTYTAAGAATAGAIAFAAGAAGTRAGRHCFRLFCFVLFCFLVEVGLVWCCFFAVCGCVG